MINKIKYYISAGLMSAAMLVGGVIAPMALTTSSVSAQSTNSISNSLCEGVNATGSDCTSTGDTASATSGIKTIAGNVTKIFTVVVGAISVIMIIYGGFRYITSGGASDKVGAAKNTLIYAIIGLIIVALANVIVSIVINQAAGQGSQL